MYEMFGYPDGYATSLSDEFRLQVLETHIAEKFGLGVRSAALRYDDMDYDEATDLLTRLVHAGADFPAVLIGDQIACADGIELEAVLGFIEASEAAASGA